MKKYLNNTIHWKTALYLICLSLYIVSFTLVREINILSCISFIRWDDYLCFIQIIQVVLLLKVICDCWEDIRIVPVILFTGAIGYFSYQYSQIDFFVPAFWFLCAGRKIKNRQITNCLFWTHLFSFLVICILCISGVVSMGAMVKSGHSRVTYCMGFSHPNMLAIKIFQLVLLYWIMKRGKLKIWDYAGIFVVNVIAMILTESRTVFLLLLLLLFCTFVYGKIDTKRITDRVIGKIQKINIIVYVGTIGLSSLFFGFFQGTDFSFLNTLGSRISQSILYFKYYGISLWGQPLMTHISDPETAKKYGLYTLDNGYMYLLLGMGIIVFLFFLFLQTGNLIWLYSKRKSEYILVYLIYFLLGFLETYVLRLSMNFTLLYLFCFIWDFLDSGTNQGVIKIIKGIWEWLKSVFKKAFAAIKGVINYYHRDKQALFEAIYLFYVVLMSLMAFKDTMMLPFGWSDTLLHFVCVTAVIVVFAKAAFEEPWEIREIIIAGVIGLALFASWHHYMRRYLLELAVLIIGARGVSFRKIVKVYFTASTIAFLTTTFLALGGFIENLTFIQAEHGNLPRYAFGSIYPTDYAAHVFYLSLCYAWLRLHRIKWKEVAIMEGIGLLCYFFCGARTTTVCITILVLLLIIYKLKLCETVIYKFRYFLCFSMPVCAAATIAVTAAYREDVPWMNVLNGFLNTRLSQGKEGFLNYPVTLLGQEVLMHGYGGGGVDESVHYFFLDSSYVNVLLQYGLLVFAVLIFMSVYSMFRLNKKEMWKEVALLMVLSLHNIMEHHLIEIAYHPFFLLTLAAIDEVRPQNLRHRRRRKRNKEYCCEQKKSKTIFEYCDDRS